MSRQQQIETEAKELRDRMVHLARQMHPLDFRACLSGTIATVMGCMSERYWDLFTKNEPCGEVGCDCHLGLQQTTIKFFTCLREDYLEHGPAEQEEQE